MRAKKLIAIFLLSTPLLAFAQEVAKCSGSSGQAYYPYAGLVPKSSSGWVADKILGGKFSIKKTGQKDFDLVYSDSQRGSVSSRQDGGKVIITRAGSAEFSLVVFYPGTATEVYTFWRSYDGQLQYSLLQSKGGTAPIPKSAVLIGRCEHINFGLMNG